MESAAGTGRIREGMPVWSLSYSASIEISFQTIAEMTSTLPSEAA